MPSFSSGGFCLLLLHALIHGNCGIVEFRAGRGCGSRYEIKTYPAKFGSILEPCSLKAILGTESNTIWPGELFLKDNILTNVHGITSLTLFLEKQMLFPRALSCSPTLKNSALSSNYECSMQPQVAK